MFQKHLLSVLCRIILILIGGQLQYETLHSPNMIYILSQAQFQSPVIAQLSCMMCDMGVKTATDEGISSSPCVRVNIVCNLESFSSVKYLGVSCFSANA